MAIRKIIIDGEEYRIRTNKIKLDVINYTHIFVEWGNVHYLIPPKFKTKAEQIKQVTEKLLHKCGCVKVIEHKWEPDDYKRVFGCEPTEDILFCSDDSFKYTIPYVF